MLAKTYIIVLNWNNSQDTITCLESLRLVAYTYTKILLVDNASTDNSLELINHYLKSSAMTSKVQLISLSTNKGFAGGNNEGIKIALQETADYVLLLNNDTLVTVDFLDHLMETIQKDSKIGVLGCRIYHYPKQNKVWFNGGRIDYLLGYGTHYRDNFKGLRECDFVTGCLMLFPAKILKEVGGFDERYFLIAEDAELCQRIKKVGYKVVVDTRVGIYHKISASMGGFYSPMTQYYFHRNRMVLMMSTLNPIQRFLFLTFQFLIVVPGWSVLEILKGKIRFVVWAWRGYKDFILGKLGKDHKS